ncbi:GIY-YIG nuclease family protein [Chryseosolibacter indicus]|uniref:GIY-YIG nuclease family protein n=1 Tax=Chryseosolibacter indicus TaxID=2782351 RepID=A0ABS5VXN5_9BACT|nr:GIY-YIG nuclease family protein [Chryseosolibacter indicus]MBT1705620.1 GIY-YIG nuclease family protein [Chryseosolibacter indicus]
MRASAFVYILTDKTRTNLYVGVTADLPAKLWEHRTKRWPSSFTARNNIFILVYYEPYAYMANAIKREKFVKGKVRQWKEELISMKNPTWRDLTDDVCS